MFAHIRQAALCVLSLLAIVSCAASTLAAEITPLLVAPPPPGETGSSVTDGIPGNPDAQFFELQTLPMLSEREPQQEETVRLIPYGSLWGNMVYTSSRTNPGSFTLWVLSEEVGGEDAFELDARRSRIGLEIIGKPLEIGLADFEQAGRIEFDFYGQFLTENRAGARLRHAYWEMTNDQWRILLGQTWDVISPLRPGMLNFSVGWDAGNIGFRRAQLRGERTISLDQQTHLLFQGSLNADIVDDFGTIPGISRESADFPVLEARTAIAFELSPQLEQAIFGISAHYGKTGFDFMVPGPPPLNLPPVNNARFDTWSINSDFEFPLNSDLVLRGEFFHGANLSPFLGGIGQGVCPCLRRAIRSTGGWIELVKYWKPGWESHVGAGIDDPNDSDSLLGRTQNQVVFANLIWHVSEELSTGVEVSGWETKYQEQRVGLIPPALLTPSSPGTAAVIEWMLRYDF